MVLSKLNKNISYTELKGVNKNDLKMEVNLYQLEILGIDVIVAVGNSVNTFEDENVTYFPLYLVKSNNKIMQIGVYEIHSTDLSHFLDDEGSLDLEKMDDPLIYKFVTKSMLLEKRMVPEKEKEDVDSESSDEEVSEEEDSKESDDDVMTTKKEHVVEIPENRRNVFVLTKNATIQPLLSEETTKDAESLRDKFNATVKSGKGENWVQNYMQNKNYYLVDNEGGGDCLFATVRDAFSQIGQQTSVQKIRNRLAEEVDEKLFYGYKENFDLIKESIEHSANEIKTYEAEHILLKERFKNELDRDEKKRISEEAKRVIKKRETAMEEKKASMANLRDFAFMKNIQTLKKFQDFIKTSAFWGETWSISTMERIFNIKFIILSSENYNAKDYSNVLLCGQMNDTYFQERGKFEPEYYIIVDHLEDHYKLIGYKNKQIFKFTELPFDLRKKVVDKCMEQNAGLFSLIPEFVEFKKEIKPNSHGTLVEGNPRFDDISDAKLQGVYDDDVVFTFYHDSNGKKLPGTGSQEKIAREQIKEYAELNSIPDWRKKLDNTWESPFTLDGHRWQTIEHFIQASKFKKDNPEFYLSFSLESGTDLSKNPEMAKSAGTFKGKQSGKYKDELIRPREVKVDEGYDEKQEERNLKNAYRAKFGENPELKKLLLATKRAKLQHHVKSKPPELMETLMIVRNEIRRDSNSF
jgi:predicted NAD-dependent protein-ADP-ribosyltransferase YbiA (DUF1768 family)